jgi:hypothetical protein
MSDTPATSPKDTMALKLPPCTAYELLLEARRIDPNVPQRAFKKALALIAEAQSYLEDPTKIDNRYRAFGEVLTATLNFCVHLPLPGQDSQDELASLARVYEVRLPTERETLLGYCREWWDIVVVAWMEAKARIGQPDTPRMRWWGDGSAPEMVTQDDARQLLLYCQRRLRKSAAEAKTSFLARGGVAEEELLKVQKRAAQRNSPLDGTSLDDAPQSGRKRSSRTASGGTASKSTN